MSTTTAAWSPNDDELATHFNHLSMDAYSTQQAQQEPHNQAHAQALNYASVHAQRPPFGYDRASPYMYYTGADYPGASTTANGTPSYSFSDLSSPLVSLQNLPSLQSLQSLSPLQSLVAANATGLAFDPYPPGSESYTHSPQNGHVQGVDSRPAATRHGGGSNSVMNMQNMGYQPQAHVRPAGRGQGAGSYRQQLQPLSAQSTGPGYFGYEDRGQFWATQTPGSGQRGGRPGRFNGNSNGPRRGRGNRYPGAADLSHALNLQQPVYQSTNAPTQYNLAATQYGANPYTSAAVVYNAAFRGFETATRSSRLDEFRRHRNGNRMELSVSDGHTFRAAIGNHTRFGRPVLTIKDISGHICEFAGDQHGSRFIQNKLETASPEERAQVFDEILPSAFHLMTDVFGNYVIQKLFEHGDQGQKMALAKTMETHVFHLSMQMYGCRVVQKALEHVLLEQRERLVAELIPNVIECVKSANANHVIQRLIALDPPALILDSFKGHVRELSCHPFGCRVLQMTFEILNPSRIRNLLNELHSCAGQLMTDQFGNYVVQSIITDAAEHKQDRDKVVEWIKPRIYEFSRHKFASNVVEKALKFAEPDDRRQLISKLIGEHTDNPEERVSSLLRDGYGNFPVQTALAEADPDQRDKLLAIIVPLMPNILHTPCGRRLEAKLNDYENKGIVPSLSHSLSASSISSPDLVTGSESESTLAEILAPPSSAKKNVALRPVSTSPDSQDETEW